VMLVKLEGVVVVVMANVSFVTLVKFSGAVVVIMPLRVALVMLVRLKWVIMAASSQ